MAKFPYRNLGTFFDRLFRNGINDNFIDIEMDFKEVQAQIDKLVIEGDSSPAAAQAAVSSSGIPYASLKERLDVEYQEQKNFTDETKAARVNAKGVGKTSLKDRLDGEYYELSEQLNSVELQKADKSYVDQKLTGTPKIISASVTELNANYPTGSTELALIAADGFLYQWKNAAWAKTAIQYQSTGIADKTVSEYKTTFAALSGKNLFDIKKLTPGYYVSQSTGALTAYVGFGVSDFIPVEAGQTYHQTRYYSDGQKIFGQAAWYDSNKVYISGLDGVEKVTAPANVAFYRVSIYDGYAKYYEFTKSAIRMPFENPYLTIERLGITEDNIKTPIGIGKLKFIKTGKNLFDKTKAILNANLNLTTGDINYLSGYYVSDFMAVEEGKNYYQNRTGGLCFYNANFEFVSSLASAYTFVIPSGAAYVRTVLPVALIDTFQFELGSVGTEYEAFKQFIKKEYIEAEPVVAPLPPSSDLDVDVYFITDKRTLNLFDKTKSNTNGYYDTSGVFRSDGSYVNDSGPISVEANKKYYLNRIGGSQPIWNFFKEDGTWVSSQGNVGNSVTVPNDLTIKYMRASLLKTEIEKAMITEGLPSYAYYFPYNSPAKYLVTHRKGEKLTTIGDSLTQMGYWQPVIQSVLGMSYEIIAQSGGNMISIANFVENIIDNPNVLTVWAGTNDWNGNIPLGTFGSTDRNTYAGALKYLIEYVSTNKQTTQLLLITPMQRADVDKGWIADEKGFLINDNGDTLEDFANMVIEYGKAYGIPVLDMFHESGVNKYNIDSYSNDKLHPTQAGFEKLAWKIIDKIKSM